MTSSSGIISSSSRIELSDEDEPSTSGDGIVDKAVVVVNNETFEISSSSNSGSSSEEGDPSINRDDHTLLSTPAISDEVRRRRRHFLMIVAFLPLIVASATLGAFLVSERDDTVLTSPVGNSSTVVSTGGLAIDEPNVESSSSSSSSSPSRTPSYLRTTMAPTLAMVTDTTNTTSPTEEVVCLTSGVCDNCDMCCSGECIQDGEGGNVCAVSSSNTTTTDTTDLAEVVVDDVVEVTNGGDAKDDGKQNGKETNKPEEKPKNEDAGKRVEAVVAKEKKDVEGKNVVDDKAEREYWNRWVTDDELNNMN